MALDCSPDNLYREIEAARRVVKAHIDCADELIRHYVGSAYRKDWLNADPQPENHAFEFISLMLGRLIVDNPAASVTSMFSQFEAIAFAMGDSLNQWIKQENLKIKLKRVVLDSFFCFGVVKSSFEKDARYAAAANGLQRMKPCAEHLPYHQYFRDPASCPGIPPRYEGHIWFRDKDELLNDKKFDRKAIEELIVDAELSQVSKAYGRARDIPDRNQIVGYEVYVPDAETDGEDPNEHGMIYTLAAVPLHQNSAKRQNKGKDGVSDDGSVQTAYIRKPRPFFGPATGPYTLFGGWEVPNAVYPLSNLAATKEQADELNAHVVAAARSAAQMKDIIIVPASSSGLANAVKDGKHGQVYKVKGYVHGQADMLSIGGPSAQQMEYLQVCRERLDRNSGISDAQRGNANTKNTATADNIANQASSVRIETQINSVKDAVAEVLSKTAWYMFHANEFSSYLSKEASAKLGMKQAAFAGGPHPSTEGLRFEDLAIEIQPHSMERVDPIVQQGRVQQLSMMMLNSLPLRLQFPFFNWKEFDLQLSRAHNAPWVVEMVDPEMLQQFVQQQQQAAAQGQRESIKPPQYKDAPSDVKLQIEKMFGLQPSQVWTQQPPFDPNQPEQALGPKRPAFLDGFGPQGLQQAASPGGMNPAQQAIIAKMMGGMGMGLRSPYRPAKRLTKLNVQLPETYPAEHISAQKTEVSIATV